MTKHGNREGAITDGFEGDDRGRGYS